MTSEEPEVAFKVIGDILVASIRRTIQSRNELMPLFKNLEESVSEYICGPPMTIFHLDTPVEGFDAEAAFPVREPVEAGGIRSRIVSGGEAWSVMHYGSYENLAQSAQKLHKYRHSRGLATALLPREIYHAGPFEDNPEDNVTEVVDVVHDWQDRFWNGLGEILGEDTRAKIVEGAEEITPHSTGFERGAWVKTALKRLEEHADEEQISEIICRCAHVRPGADIAQFREVYEKNHDLDELMAAYAESQGWIEKPYRKGNVIYTTKVPMNREGWENATTLKEKIPQFCYCPVVHHLLDETPSIFCHCGGGWARQVFEGVLGVKVKVKLLKTVVAGDNVCAWELHLPEDFA
ncbi:MAG: GyrI-like domain-containing protein [Candidatus Thorarchaeota archaeon]|nr:MAG: GyrI-like domain-containing protein [Candidatus Thorarchaeota archaeon]